MIQYISFTTQALTWIPKNYFIYLHNAYFLKGIWNSDGYILHEINKGGMDCDETFKDIARPIFLPKSCGYFT